jgi:hypothetical protein
MKRFLRILVLTGSVCLLLLVTARRGPAQPGMHDSSCCSLENENKTTDFPCGHCTVGPHGSYDGGFCSYSGGSDAMADGCEATNTGTQSIFDGGTRNCFTTYTACSTGDSCPSTYEYYYFDDDPLDCSSLPSGCGTSGMSCSNSNPCCGAYSCVNGTC